MNTSKTKGLFELGVHMWLRLISLVIHICVDSADMTLHKENLLCVTRSSLMDSRMHVLLIALKIG